MYRALIFIVFLLSFLPLSSQYHGHPSKKAVRNYEQALERYRAYDNAGAEEALQAALKAEDRFLEARQLLSQICYEQGRLDEAILHFRQTLEIDSAGNPEGFRLLAGMKLMNCDYAGAMSDLETYLAQPPELTKSRAKAELLLEQCIFALEALENPVEFVPENLGDSVNSEWNEYWPFLSVDEQELVFTVLVPLEGEGSGYQEDFYSSRKSGESWAGRASLGRPLNTIDNEGAHSITADGKLLFFTACNRRDGRGRCDIYYALRSDRGWGRAINLGAPVNSGFSEKQPSISPDGRMLIFSSNRPGGRGSYDLWMSILGENGWSKPVNLGEVINTAGLEQSPFLHPDGRSLYFSTDGRPGMGQGDLFMSRRLNDSSWSEPRNLGYPINTCGDDFGFSVNAAGDRAYFASDREGLGHTDIYTFSLSGDLRPDPVSYLRGRVHDAGNMRGLVAELQLIDLETEELVMQSFSGKGEGDFLLALPSDRDYALNVSAPGYLFYSGNFQLRGAYSKARPYRKDVPLQPLKSGSRVVLNNVFFASDSDVLEDQSRAELNKVASFMEQNKGVGIEIGGHTDNTGTADYNLDLSRKRAEAVMNYLISCGIDGGRMKAAGYGDTRAVADNSTEEGRARNRRTEFKIMFVEE